MSKENMEVPNETASMETPVDSEKKGERHWEMQMITNPETGNIYRTGDRVTVSRTGGDIERDWEFISVLDNGDILAGKGPASKRIDRESFIHNQLILDTGKTKLGIGECATVKRSSGKEESDWKLKSFGEGMAVLQKPNTTEKDENGQVQPFTYKVVSLDLLKKWQNERMEKEGGKNEEIEHSDES